MSIPFPEPFDVPRRVAECPYCGAPLTAYVNEWEELRSGRERPVGIQVDCTNEPDIDSDDWENWWSSHSVMPYVYQLPVDERVLAWLQRHTARRFKDTQATGAQTFTEDK